jgi:hypothetical protein
MSITRYFKEQPNGEIEVEEVIEDIYTKERVSRKLKKEEWNDDIKEIINKRKADKKAK